MKNIKKIIILLLVLLFTGCTGSYNLTINEDLSVTEKLDLKINASPGAYESTIKLFDDYNVPKKNYKVVDSEEDIKIKYEENYESLDEYIIESKIYKNMFSDIIYNKEDRKIDISTQSNLYLKENYSRNIIDNYDITKLDINLKTPLTIERHNADKAKDDTYTWSIDTNTNNKKIVFSIDLNKNTNDYVQIVIIFSMIVLVAAFLIIVFTRIKKRQKV